MEITRTRLAAAVLALALVAGIGLRVGGTAPKTSFTHDEAISYIAASCHQGEYQRTTFDHRPPYGRWVTAADWQRLLRPERAGCLGRIADDLARFDIHPPLYFWLLHGWSLLFGVGVWTGTSLNILLSALGTLALFGLARRVLGDPVLAALVAFTWAVSPGVIEVFAEARQYELFGLLTVLAVWLALRLLDAPSGRAGLDGAGLAAVVGAGMLTHYHFALVAVGLAGLMVHRLARRPGRLLEGLGALAAGGIAFVLLHPGFWSALATQRRQAGGFVAEQLPGRINEVADTLGALVLPPGAADGPLGWIAAALLIAATFWLGGSLLRRGGERSSAGGVALAFAAWMGGVTVALYLGFISHGLAMTPKYLAAVWPFAAFVPVLALSRLGRPWRRRAAVTGATLLLAMGVISAVRLHADEAPVDPSGVAGRADSVVVDNVARGIFPRVVWTLRPHTRVFAADQGFLLSRPPDWLGALRGRSILVTDLPVSDPRYGNSPERARRLLEVARRGRRVTPLDQGLAGLGRVYELR